MSMSVSVTLSDDHREEAVKACEADAAKTRGALRQERIDWEKADAESRSTLQSLREEWRMLQETNAQLHANVMRLTKAFEVTSPPVLPHGYTYAVTFAMSAVLHTLLFSYINV